MDKMNSDDEGSKGCKTAWRGLKLKTKLTDKEGKLTDKGAEMNKNRNYFPIMQILNTILF